MDQYLESDFFFDSILSFIRLNHPKEYSIDLIKKIGGRKVLPPYYNGLDNFENNVPIPVNYFSFGIEINEVTQEKWFIIPKSYLETENFEGLFRISRNFGIVETEFEITSTIDETNDCELRIYLVLKFKNSEESAMEFRFVKFYDLFKFCSCCHLGYIHSGKQRPINDLFLQYLKQLERISSERILYLINKARFVKEYSFYTIENFNSKIAIQELKDCIDIQDKGLKDDSYYEILQEYFSHQISSVSDLILNSSNKSGEVDRQILEKVADFVVYLEICDFKNGFLIPKSSASQIDFLNRIKQIFQSEYYIGVLQSYQKLISTMLSSKLFKLDNSFPRSITSEFDFLNLEIIKDTTIDTLVWDINESRKKGLFIISYADSFNTISEIGNTPSVMYEKFSFNLFENIIVEQKELQKDGSFKLKKYQRIYGVDLLFLSELALFYADNNQKKLASDIFHTILDLVFGVATVYYGVIAIEGLFELVSELTFKSFIANSKSLVENIVDKVDDIFDLVIKVCELAGLDAGALNAISGITTQANLGINGFNLLYRASLRIRGLKFDESKFPVLNGTINRKVFEQYDDKVKKALQALVAIGESGTKKLDDINQIVNKEIEHALKINKNLTKDDIIVLRTESFFRQIDPDTYFKEFDYRDFFRIPPKTLCLYGNTLVHTNNGKVQIKDIVPGDLVYSLNEKTLKLELKEVLEVFNNFSEELFDLEINSEKITITPSHPVGLYIEDGMVKYSTVLNCYVDSIYSILDTNLDTNLFFISKLKLSKSPVFNLKIKDNHNYFIGSKGYLVHNGDEKVSSFFDTNLENWAFYHYDEDNYVGRTFRPLKRRIEHEYLSNRKSMPNYFDFHHEVLKRKSIEIDGVKMISLNVFEAACWENYYICRTGGPSKINEVFGTANKKFAVSFFKFNLVKKVANFNPCV